jgi:hypothetical protein
MRTSPQTRNSNQQLPQVEKQTREQQIKLTFGMRFGHRGNIESAILLRVDAKQR